MLVTTNVDPVAKIKVVGIGGGGCNAINTMITDYEINGVEFMAFNTDAQALKMSQAPTTLQLGEELTQGLGVGGNAELGAQAAEESIDEIQELLEGANMIFITAGMGGGTGTGAAPIIAGIARNMGALTVAVVTAPFDFEGEQRKEVAQEGIDSLKDKVDTLIIVPNQRLLEIVDDSEKLSFIDAMKKVDSVLAEGVSSISSLISQTGYINADFNDAKSVMQNSGTALMGIGRASGDNRAEEAAREATTSPLLDMSIEGATGVLYNVVGADLTLPEISLVSELIKEAVDPSANIKFGAEIDPEAGEEISITIVATGFDTRKQVFTKKQKDYGSTTVRTFGFDSEEEGITRVEEEDDEAENVEKSSSSKVTKEEEKEDLPSLEGDDDTGEKKPQKPEDLAKDIEDEMEIPAFMRRDTGN
ncbi:MAG: cell division protein FtsZ [Thermodesulfobacteriota bacterium]|nr:cell division protein FtsZ [Thermodesulfobacteriota bacterium]